jgi:hypothetical protein
VQRDEAIDCQAIELIRDDILPYANVLPETFISKILNILNRGSIYSCTTDNFIGEQYLSMSDGFVIALSIE